MLYKHRLKTSLEKGLNQGKRYFFIYGDGIKDCFLEGMYEGVYSLSETLSKYFLSKRDCRFFVLAGNDGVFVYTMEDGVISDVSAEFLLPKKVDDDMPEEEEGDSQEVSHRQIAQEAGDLNDSMRSSGVNVKNHLHMVQDRVKENTDHNSKIAVFLENFEWMAKLYSTNNDESLDFIKLLKDFMKLENCYMIASLEDIRLLERYNFALKGTNVVFIGNPSAKEVKYAYLRRFLKLTQFKGDIQENLLSELEDISQAVSSSKKSLREALHVFDTLVTGKEKDVIDKTDFEIAVEKITAEAVALDDVVIEEKDKRRILNAVDAFIENDDIREYRKGFILTGPPGTGKTLIVKAIANERNCYFMAPTLSELKGEYIGHSSMKVKRIFDEARANAPAILFIDEADTVFPMRDSQYGDSDSFSKDMVNQFLQEIDGMKTGREKIFVIAATNRPNIIDAAILSRLTERIPINLPSAPNRIRIFDKKLEKYHFSIGDKSYRNEIESKTVNMSGRDIDNFVKILRESIADTPFHEISNLKDNDESKDVLLEILKENEKILIEDMRRSVPVDVKEPVELQVQYRDVIGYEDIKTRINRQARFIRCPEEEKLRMKQLGIKVSKGILLYGPSGNAKTMLAEAAAKENNFYFIKVISKDFISDSVTKQLDNLRIIFDQTLRLSKMCSKYEGVLLFFDEVDSLAGKSSLSKVIRGTLLDYLAAGDSGTKTGIRSAQSRILLMAATNFLNQLDEAVIRKGRIDEHLFMDNPLPEEGIEMFRQLFRKEASTVVLEDELLLGDMYTYLAECNPQARPSGSDIVNLFHDMKAEAFYDQKDCIKGKDTLKINTELFGKYTGDDWQRRRAGARGNG